MQKIYIDMVADISCIPTFNLYIKKKELGGGGGGGGGPDFHHLRQDFWTSFPGLEDRESIRENCMQLFFCWKSFRIS